MAEQIVRLLLSEIAPPAEYVRKKWDTARVNMFTDMVRGGPDQLPREQWTWPFPPIKVFRLPAPLQIDYKTPDGKKAVRTVNYRIDDGVHRYMTAIQTGRADIESIIIPTITDPAQALASQYIANRNGILPFTREERDAFIRAMVNVHKVPLDKVAEITQLSKASASRISTGDQGKTKEETSAARKKGAKKRGQKREAGESASYKPADFFSRVRTLSVEIKEHRQALVQALTVKDGPWLICEGLIRSLNGLRETAGK